MNCETVKKCACPKTSCSNHMKCCACVANHRAKDGLPYCLFPNNGGDKSVKNYYLKLKERFEDK